MRVSCIYCLMGVLLFAGNAHATDASSYASSWGASMATCPTHNFTSYNGCLSNCSGASNGKNMMVARAVNSNGAKFCLTYVNSIRNNSTQQPWTEYHQAVGAGDCVWLCKPGWTGDECKTSTSGGTSSSTCDSITIKSSSYTGKADACTKPKNKNISCSTSNVESTISFLVKSAKYDCSSNPFGGKDKTATYKMEHDVILGITGWTSSGHGAFAQPIVVWAWCPKGKNDENCKLAVSPQKSKQLLCKDGYKPNSSKSDCEAINGYVCQGIKDCSGWSASRFQGSTYKTVVVNENSGSCTQYRCATSNYGFEGDPKLNNKCIACTGLFKSISSTNGQCVEDTVAKKKAQEEADRIANTFSVAYSCGEGTGAAPNGGSILRGNNYTPATNTCTAPSGHSFAGWTVSGTNETKSAGSAFKWEWTENKTFTAKWSAGTYSITYHVNGGTNNVSNPATYKVTTSTITLGAPTRENSSFVGWYTDSGLTSSASQIVQGSTGDKTFYAKWSCNTGYSPNSGNTACVQDSVPEPEPQPQPEPEPEPQPQPEPETVQDTVEDVYVEPVEPSPVIEIVKEDTVEKLYVVGKAEMRICWLKNGSPKEFKECVYNIMGGRIDAPAASQGVSASNSVTYVAPTPDPAPSASVAPETPVTTPPVSEQQTDRDTVEPALPVIEDVVFEKDKQSGTGNDFKKIEFQPLPVLDKTDIKFDKTNLQKVDNFVLKDTPLLKEKTTGGTGNSSGVGGNINSGSNTSGGKLQQVEFKVQKPSLIKPQAEMFSIK